MTMAILINTRWIDIKENEIYDNLNRLGPKGWGARAIPVAGSLRHYLFGGQYAYPYSLPIKVIDRLANRLNGNEVTRMDLDFHKWIEKFREHREQTGTIYNDTPNPPAGLPAVTIKSPAGSNWRVLGIHKLTSDENNGNHNVFVEVLCKQGDRAGFQPVEWDWHGRGNYEAAPGPVFAGQKDLTELVDLPIHIPMKIRIWIQGGDEASLFHSEFPDEGHGNTYGNHSFFLCFEEVDHSEPLPIPDPTPDPPPGPTQPKIQISLTVNWEWVNSLTPDENGNITIEGILN